MKSVIRWNEEKSEEAMTRLPWMLAWYQVGCKGGGQGHHASLEVVTHPFL